MKHFTTRFLTLLTLLASMTLHAETVRLSEPVAVDTTSETFGALLDETLPKLSLTRLLQKPESHMGKPFIVKTRIAKVCQKKGCFFIAQQDEHIVRVSFKDYGFFIPTNTSGKTVTLAGVLVEKELTAKQAAHFKADLKSKEDVVKAGKVYEIVASSVKIPFA